MGFMDEYYKALQDDKPKGGSGGGSSGGGSSSFMDEYYKAGGSAPSTKKTSGIGDNAPTFKATRTSEKKKKKKEEEERSWFKKGLFDDGYDFGDISRTILGTATDVLENVGSGIIGMGEKAVDAMAYIAPFAANGQFYQNGGGYNLELQKQHEKVVEQSKKDLGKFVAKDLYDEEKIARAIISDPARMIGVDSESHSVFGEKSDALIQSGGQLLATAGLSAVGVPWFVTTGATSFGSEAENAMNQGATYEEAGASAAISAGAEILSEKLSGGISFGGKTLDDALTKQLARGISNKIGRTFAKLGIDMAGEGAEEVFSQVASNIGSSLYKEESLNDLLFSEEAFDEYLESFIGGAALGGVANTFNAVKSNKQGVDYTSGLTANEETVIKKVYNDRVAEAEKNGKVSQKEKSRMYDQVVSEMDKGYLSIDDIESALGGKTYEDYKSISEWEDGLQKEYDELHTMKRGEMTGEQIDREAELKKQLEESRATGSRDSLKSQLGNEVFGLVKGDRLVESYNERTRRGQAFEADITKYDAKQQATIQKAIDSGILNNTNRTHEFVDIISKISADKGVLFDFTNNTKLKESGFAVEGKQVNGFVTKDGITLNIDSPKAWQSTVGHEITHVLEGTELYKELQKTMFDYAEKKGELGSRLSSLKELYKDVKDADVNAELTADLVGEYLFTDEDFIKNLSTEHRNVFQKIYDEIKYLVKVATGSKEARELEKVKRAFDKAYKEAGKGLSDTKYSISSEGKELTKEQQEFFKDSKMRDENGNLKVMYHGSQDAGFHVFDPKMSDDDTSFFFVDNVDVAASYSGSYETYEAKTIRTADDMRNFLQSIGYEGYEVFEEGENHWIDDPDGDYCAGGKTWAECYEEFCWYEGIGDGDANYKVYLNLKNPLEVDAQGRNWNNVSREYSQEIADRYNSLTSEEKAALHDIAGWGEISIFRDEIRHAKDDALASAYEKMGDVNMYDLFTIAEDNFDEATIKQFAVKQMNTRDFAKKAKAEGYDGVIFKNIVDVGGFGNGDEGAATVAIAFDSNQIKSVANAKPTTDPDIRYSLSADSEGRELSPATAKRFGKSKVVDENGNLKAVYHGTATGEFSIFDKSKGSVEGDFGSGFYFTDNEADVSEHYEGGGPDFENKVARLAEQIEADEDIDYEEAEERARAELFKGSHKFEVYLNIENPAIVGETILLDSESYLEQYNEEDYEDYDEYIADVEQLLADDIENIVWEVERNVDIDSADGLADVLYEAYYEGGIGIEELKAKINELYLEDSNGNLAGNEVARQVIESLGYDGIIDPTVSGKWNMDIEDGTTHYIVFKPNQIKAVTNQNPTDNPDIHRSLSKIGEAPRKTGRFATPATELRLTTEDSTDVAPVAENATVQEKTQLTEENATDVTAADMQALFPDDAVPVQEELERLDAHRKQLYGALEDAVNNGSANDVGKLAAEYEEINSRIKELEQEEAERTGSLTDAPPEMDAPFYGEPSKPTVPDDPFYDRDISDVGKRSVKAYQYENPEVKPFFQEAALGMLYDVANTTKGEKWYNDELYYATGGEKGFGGTKRSTTDDIAELKDVWGYTYEQIEKGLNAIIEDDGKENNAVSKRIEFMLNDRLLNGYTDVDGRPYEPNQDYIRLLNEKQVTEYSKEAFDSFMANADAYAPPVEDIAPVKPLKKATADTMDAPIFESKDKNAVKGQTTMFEPPKPNPKVANVLTEESAIAKEKSGIGTKLVSALVDKGMVFENLSLKTGNHELQAKWNYTLPSNTEARAQHFMEKGAKGVKPLKDIKKTVDKSGKADDFFSYLYHVHNIDRMTLEDRFGVENKTVFGETVTANVSRQKVAQYEKKNPEFKSWANDVYAYNKHLRQLLVDGNVISQETANLWEKMYPHYVPIRRVDSKGNNISVPLDTNKTGVNNPVKRATGGNSDIQPVFSTMAQRTEQTYRAIARNAFGIELKNTLGTTINSQENTTGVDEAVDTLVAQEDHLLKPGTMTSNPTFTVFENGEKVEFEITEDMFDALKPAGKVLGHRSKAVTWVSEGRRNLLTTWNPVFALYRNPIKDLQDVGVNSQHPVKTYANVPNAIYQIATGGKWATEYAENGGKSNTYFDSRSNKFKAEDSVFKKTIGMPLKALEAAGEFIEEIPRLAEYIASRKDGRSVERSMLDAARVTTNFAAGGDFTKFLNSHGFTFLNASVQGASQHVRNFREAKQQGLKGYVKVLAKYTVAGLPGILLNNLLWDDDEEYEELNDYVKQNYYVVAKTQDGKFIRIPKGRTAAVMQNAMEQMEHLVTGDDEADFGTFYELFMNNIAPNNPIENNILAPIWQAKNNEAWYGGDLVPSRLQKLPAEEQFDESTDAFSKLIGEKTGISPYKLNYLIDQYSGGLGDMLLPMATPEAESGDNSFVGNLLAPWKKEMTTDTVLNNRNPGDFYELRDELEVVSNSKNATEEDKMRNMYLDSVSWEMSDLYAKKREIQNSDLPDDEKYEAVREVQEEINGLAKNAMENQHHVQITGLYSEAGDRRYNLDAESGKWYEIKPKNADGSDNWYYQKEQEVTKGLGISYEQYWNNREEYNYAYDKPGKYALAQAVGGYDSYMRHYDVLENWQSDSYLSADKDSKGNSISGSRKEKVIDYINGLDADYGEKIILYRTVYSSKADKRAYNQEIVDYLNSRDDISYGEMKSILEELDMEVDSEGNITW